MPVSRAVVGDAFGEEVVLKLEPVNRVSVVAETWIKLYAIEASTRAA